ncbi:hypothetical protein OGAPHI_004513 [Ogataea philodendri]|uniref:Uncharacterized protein n=1 Tax=Ogataea philodendri TaxID=1378263 RepID=A0A9P8P7C8_9ASCO|nr:uncharacterized protein OGAPHI_004513 [Ogataea philodendri]KAH3666324.1 hypothetical protein OGAPHI_004513 [Ogataea philodendri]
MSEVTETQPIVGSVSILLYTVGLFEDFSRRVTDSTTGGSSRSIGSFQNGVLLVLGTIAVLNHGASQRSTSR